MVVSMADSTGEVMTEISLTPIDTPVIKQMEFPVLTIFYDSVTEEVCAECGYLFPKGTTHHCWKVDRI